MIEYLNWWENDLTESQRNNIIQNIYKIFVLKNVNLENSLEKKIDLLEKELKEKQNQFEEEKKQIEEENYKILNEHKSNLDQNTKYWQNQITNLVEKNNTIEEDCNKRFIEWKQMIEGKYTNDIEVLKEKNTNNIEFLKKEKEYLIEKNATELESLKKENEKFNNMNLFFQQQNSNSKGLLGEYCTLELLRSSYQSEDIEHTAYDKDNGDIIATIRDTKILIDVKTHTNQTQKKSFVQTRKDFIKTVEVSKKKDRKIDMAILEYPIATGIPVKSQLNDKFIHTKENNIELEFVLIDDVQFPIFYVCNTAKYNINLILTINIGIKILNELKLLNTTNLKKNFKRIQSLIHDIQIRHEKNMKLIKNLTENYDEEYKNILDLVDVLLSEKDMQYESDEFNMKAEIQKIIDYLNENKIKVNKKNIIEFKEKVNSNISKTCIKNISIKNFM